VICYAVGKVTLEQDAIVSQGAHLCAATHDHRDPDFPLMAGDITIGTRAWVCADAFVGPDIVIGRRAVVAARAVIIRDVEDGVVVAGNPGRIVGTRS
jgi:putative colanic acid biosynthesis acetyltransferase WcaF